MSKVDKLKTEVEGLPKEEFAELARWLSCAGGRWRPGFHLGLDRSSCRVRENHQTTGL